MRPPSALSRRGIQSSRKVKQSKDDGIYTLKLFPHGISGSVTPTMRTNRKRKGTQKTRAQSKGWTRKSTINCRNLLQSVDIESLEDCWRQYGYFVTLTVKDCPPWHEAFTRIRESFLKRLRKLGLIHHLWTTEFSNGRPHIHAMIWLTRPLMDKWILSAWIKSAKQFKPDPVNSQKIKEIYDLNGLLQYFNKSVTNYQRQTSSVPSHWTNAGKVWGCSRNFPTLPAEKLTMIRKKWYIARRINQKVKIGKKQRALKRENSKKPYSQRIFELKMAKNYLKCGERKRSSVRGFNLSIGNRDRKKLIRYLETLE